MSVGGRKRQLILGGDYILCVIYEIFFIIFLFTNKSLIATQLNLFQCVFGPFINISLSIIIMAFVITGFHSFYGPLKSDDLIVKVKGYLVFFGSIFLLFGMVLDLLSFLVFGAVVISRLILMLCAITYYFGFLMPDWMKSRIMNSKFGQKRKA